ncbi:MAG: leucine-rich repeat domain-containing protein [Oscillospiraceae bacterium]|nr:leucine-rich repeat domain-containing protein [Oscillospiraceae bacterium]
MDKNKDGILSEAVINNDGRVSMVTVSSGSDYDDDYADEFDCHINEHNRNIIDSDGELIDWRLRGKNLCIRISADEKIIPYRAHCDDKDAGVVLIADGVTEIGGEAFRECRNLRRIDIPDSVVKIGKYAFYECWLLREITVPKGVKKIEEGAFSRCRTLETVTFNGGVEDIEMSAFDCCVSLEKIILPNGVKKIYSYAFHECCSLQSLTLPNSIERIFPNAFSGCESLKNISYKGQVYDDIDYVLYLANRQR